ncbi:MAG: DUF4169 family protein [Afipia sp.]|nr:DUF4169 family protein [Afipia sp.]
MGDLVNLKQVKKRIAREDAAKQSETNRARFGRTKNERSRDELQAKRASDVLDQHRTDDGKSA